MGNSDWSRKQTEIGQLYMYKKVLDLATLEVYEIDTKQPYWTTQKWRQH